MLGFMQHRGLNPKPQHSRQTLPIKLRSQLLTSLKVGQLCAINSDAPHPPSFGTEFFPTVVCICEICYFSQVDYDISNMGISNTMEHPI